MKATNIIWDIDDDIDNDVDKSLPKEVKIPREVKIDEIADYLSDKYSFCVYQFDIEED